MYSIAIKWGYPPPFSGTRKLSRHFVSLQLVSQDCERLQKQAGKLEHASSSHTIL